MSLDIIHAVYVVSSDDGAVLLNSTYLTEEDAFAKARECYGAFDEVRITRVLVKPIRSTTQEGAPS